MTSFAWPYIDVAAGSPDQEPPCPASAGRICSGAFWFGPVVRPVGASVHFGCDVDLGRGLSVAVVCVCVCVCGGGCGAC